MGIITITASNYRADVVRGVSGVYYAAIRNHGETEPFHRSAGFFSVDEAAEYALRFILGNGATVARAS